MKVIFGELHTDTEVFGLGFEEGVLDGLGCLTRCVRGGGGLLACSFGLGLVIETRVLAIGKSDRSPSHCLGALALAVNSEPSICFIAPHTARLHN